MQKIEHATVVVQWPGQFTIRLQYYRLRQVNLTCVPVFAANVQHRGPCVHWNITFHNSDKFDARFRIPLDWSHLDVSIHKCICLYSSGKFNTHHEKIVAVNLQCALLGVVHTLALRHYSTHLQVWDPSILFTPYGFGNKRSWVSSRWYQFLTFEENLPECSANLLNQHSRKQVCIECLAAHGG